MAGFAQKCLIWNSLRERDREREMGEVPIFDSKTNFPWPISNVRTYVGTCLPYQIRYQLSE